MEDNQLLANTIRGIMLDAGYDGFVDFYRRSGTQVSPETVRRAITTGRVAPHTLFYILHDLQVSHEAMIPLLRQAGDTIIWKHLKESTGITLTDTEQEFILKQRRLEKDPQLFQMYRTIVEEFFKYSRKDKG